MSSLTLIYTLLVSCWGDWKCETGKRSTQAWKAWCHWPYKARSDVAQKML